MIKLAKNSWGVSGELVTMRRVRYGVNVFVRDSTGRLWRCCFVTLPRIPEIEASWQAFAYCWRPTIEEVLS